MSSKMAPGGPREASGRPRGGPGEAPGTIFGTFFGRFLDVFWSMFFQHCSCNSQLYLTLIRATMENLIDR